MKIVVTGAAGFIGSHLCEKLADLGHEVFGIDCFTSYYFRGLKELNAVALKAKGVKLFTLDLAVDALSEVLRGTEIIYHLAAQPGISQKATFADYLRNNIIATHQLLEAAKNIAALRLFVNVATSSIYGSQATGSEEAEPKPTSYYGVTKLAAEQLVLACARDKGFPACSTRLFSVYGPRERPEKVYPKYIRAIFDNDYVFTYREGSDKHVRSFTYVDDIVDGFVAVLNNLDKCVGEIFNLGLDKPITTGEALQLMENITGRKAKVEVVPKVSGDQLETRANIGKARKLLGYNPKTCPAEGFAKFVEWYKASIVGKAEFKCDLY